MSFTKIILHGDLQFLFGREFRKALRTASEAVTAIDSCKDGFITLLKQRAAEGTHYHIIGDGQLIKGQEVFAKKEYEEIHIMPAISSSGPFIPIIVGILAYGGGATVGGALGAALVNFGIALIITGVMMLAFPPPKINNDSQVSAGTNSYYFSGVFNPKQQGSVIPLGYGRMRAGAYVISSAIDNSRIKSIQNEFVGTLEIGVSPMTYEEWLNSPLVPANPRTKRLWAYNQYLNNLSVSLNNQRVEYAKEFYAG